LTLNGDIAIQWEWSNFDPSQNPYPLTDYDPASEMTCIVSSGALNSTHSQTDYDKTLHDWIRPRDEDVSQNLCQSAVRERLAKYVKYKAYF